MTCACAPHAWPVRPASAARFAAMLLALLTPLVAWGKSVEDLLVEGDRHYSQAQLGEARDAYRAAFQAAPGSFTVSCRLARTESELAELQKGDEQRQTRSEAVEHARAAVKAAPDSAAGHLWLAISLGRQALSEGPKVRLALSREIKAEADRALAIDPGMGRAWHVVALWNVKLSSLNAFERMAANTVLGGVPRGASFENAGKAFQRAIALEPAYVNHRLEYGRFLKDRHRPAEAKRELEKALTLPPTSDALDARYQSEARELLAKLK